ncbi:hypothetical protein ACF0H5_016477 [Mactra antiquata]
MFTNIDQHQYQEHHLKVIDISYTSTVTCDNEDQGRGNWSRKLDYIMSCLSYVIGLGSIWRFPYVCFRNGGGAFLIPFITMLFVIGIPLVFLELSFGQFASLGIVSIWKASPIFEGIGWAMFLSSFFKTLYYNMIIAYCIYYLFASFKTTLPWKECGEWSSEACSNVRTDGVKNCTDNGGVFCYDKCFYQNKVSSSTWNNVTNCPVGNLISPSDDYFHKAVLDITNSIYDIGSIIWELALCLLLACVILSFCLAKGIKSSGKVAYFTTIFPSLVLGMLLVRSITLKGSVDGIIYFFKPKWYKLLEAKVWGDAAVQIFFSLSPGTGGLITFSSYNKFKNNCFNNIGYMAAELKQPISEVMQPGAGLAFIVYPDVVTRLPVSQLWSVLFFIMLMTLGIGSQGGMYVLQLFDNYASTFSLLVVGVMESIALSWVYGGDRFLTDIESMLGYKPRYLWVWCWRIIVPVSILSIKYLCKADVEWGPAKTISKNECKDIKCVPKVGRPPTTNHSGTLMDVIHIG